MLVVRAAETHAQAHTLRTLDAARDRLVLQQAQCLTDRSPAPPALLVDVARVSCLATQYAHTDPTRRALDISSSDDEAEEEAIPEDTVNRYDRDCAAAPGLTLFSRAEGRKR